MSIPPIYRLSCWVIKSGPPDLAGNCMLHTVKDMRANNRGLCWDRF